MPLIDLLPETLRSNSNQQELAEFTHVLTKFCEEYALGNTIEDSLILKRLQTLFNSAPTSISACTKIVKLYDAYFSLLLANQMQTRAQRTQALMLVNNTEAVSVEPYIAVEEDDDSIIGFQNEDILSKNITENNFYYIAHENSGILMCLTDYNVTEEKEEGKKSKFFYVLNTTNGPSKIYVIRPTENDINFTLLNGYIRLTRAISQNREEFLNGGLTEEALKNLIFPAGQSAHNLVQQLSHIPNDLRIKLNELFGKEFVRKFYLELDSIYKDIMQEIFLRAPSTDEMALHIINSLYTKREETLSYNELVDFERAFQSSRAELPNTLLPRKTAKYKEILKDKFLKLFEEQPQGPGFFEKTQDLFDEIYAENSNQLEADDNNSNLILLSALFEKTKNQLSYAEVVLFQNIFQLLNNSVPAAILELENIKFRDDQRNKLRHNFEHNERLGEDLFKKFEENFNQIYSKVLRVETDIALLKHVLTELYNKVKGDLSYDELLKFEGVFIQLATPFPEDFLARKKELFAQVLSENENNLQVVKVAKYIRTSDIDPAKREAEAKIKLEAAKRYLVDEYAAANLTLREDNLYTNLRRSAETARVTAVNKILDLINKPVYTASIKLEALEKFLEAESLKSLVGEEGGGLREKMTQVGPKFLKAIPHVGRKSLATVIREIKENILAPQINIPVLSDEDQESVLVKEACSDIQKYKTLMLDETKYDALTKDHKAALFLSNPKLFAFYVVKYYAHKQFSDFVVSPFNSDITIDISLLNALISAPDNNSKRDKKNRLLLSLGFKQDLPDNRAYLNYRSDPEGLSQEERYQLVAADVPVGEHYLFAHYRDMFLNKFPQEMMEMLPEENRVAPIANNSAQTVFYLLPTNIYPRLETADYAAYDNNMFAKDIIGLVTASQPVIVCGIMNVGGDHYIPYFANYNQSTNTITLVTVDPYSQLYPNAGKGMVPRDTKDKTFRRLNELFSKMFSNQNVNFKFKDLGVDQQLNGYDCGFHSFDTLETAVSTFGKENALIRLNGGEMVFDTKQLLVNASSSKGFDYQTGRYYYGQNFLEESKKPRARWSERFKQSGISISYYKGDQASLSLQSELSLFIDTDNYSYEKNVRTQCREDAFGETKSFVLSTFISSPHGYSAEIKKHYEATLSITDQLEKLSTFYDLMIGKLNKAGIENEDVAKDELYKIVHDYLIQNNLKEAIVNFFKNKIDSLLEQHMFSEKINYIEKFFISFPEAKDEFARLTENDRQLIENEFAKKVKEGIAKNLKKSKAAIESLFESKIDSLLVQYSFSEEVNYIEAFFANFPTAADEFERLTGVQGDPIKNQLKKELSEKIEKRIAKNLYATEYKGAMSPPEGQDALVFLTKFFKKLDSSAQHAFDMPNMPNKRELKILLMNEALKLIDENIESSIEKFLSQHPFYIMNGANENTVRQAMAQENDIFNHSLISSRFSRIYDNILKAKVGDLYKELDLNIIRKYSSLSDYNDSEGLAVLFSRLANKGFLLFRDFTVGNPPKLTSAGEKFVEARATGIIQFFAEKKAVVGNAINFQKSISNILELLEKDASLSAEIRNQMIELNLVFEEYKEAFIANIDGTNGNVEALDAQMRTASIFTFNRVIGLIERLDKAANAFFIDKNTKLKYKVIALALLGQSFDATLIGAILENNFIVIDKYISNKLESVKNDKVKYLFNADFNNAFEKPVYKYGQSLSSLELRGQYFTYCLLNNKTELLEFFGEMRGMLSKEKGIKLSQSLLKLSQNSSDEMVRDVAWELYNSDPFTFNNAAMQIDLSEESVLTLEKLEKLITEKNLRPAIVESTEEKPATILNLRKAPDSIDFVLANIKKRHMNELNFALDYNDLKELESFVAKRQSKSAKNPSAEGWNALYGRIKSELEQYEESSQAAPTSLPSSSLGSKKGTWF